MKKQIIGLMVFLILCGVNSNLIAKSKNISFEFDFVARDASDEYDIVMNDDGTLQSGDRFQIHFKAHQESYVYIINQDAKGNMTVLYPTDGNKQNKLETNKEYIMPGENSFYELDDVTGQEVVYMIGSNTPMDDIQKSLEKLKGEATETTILLKKIKTRGVAKIVKKGIKLKNPSENAEILEGKNDLVRVFKINHVAPDAPKAKTRGLKKRLKMKAKDMTGTSG